MSQRYACSAVSPHISAVGRSPTHTAGRSGFPNSLQRLSLVSWTQRMPAGFPCGMPGMGEEIDGAMQQAPQPTRHAISIESDCIPTNSIARSAQVPKR
jgi:hypothetical protein